MPEESLTSNGPSSFSNQKLQGTIQPTNNGRLHNTLFYTADPASDGARTIPRPFIQSGFTGSRFAKVDGLKTHHYHHHQPQNHHNYHHHQHSLQPRNGLLVEMPLSLTKSQSVTNLPSRTTPIHHHHHLEGMFTIHDGEEEPFTTGETNSADDFG